jgi:hypothetical protein
MARFSRRPGRPSLPPEVLQALQLPRGERVLTFGVDDNTGDHVVATNHSLAAVAANGTVRLRRPWHLVDAGVWSHDAWTLTVSWVDGSRPAQWSFKEQEIRLPETLRERVQASVVLTAELSFPGQGKGRVAIRHDQASGELLSQTLLGRGVHGDDPAVKAQVRAVLNDLRDEVGLPPTP